MYPKNKQLDLPEYLKHNFLPPTSGVLFFSFLPGHCFTHLDSVSQADLLQSGRLI